MPAHVVVAPGDVRFFLLPAKVHLDGVREAAAAGPVQRGHGAAAADRGGADADLMQLPERRRAIWNLDLLMLGRRGLARRCRFLSLGDQDADRPDAGEAPDRDRS